MIKIFYVFEAFPFQSKCQPFLNNFFLSYEILMLDLWHIFLLNTRTDAHKTDHFVTLNVRSSIDFVFLTDFEQETNYTENQGRHPFHLYPQLNLRVQD